MQENMVWYVCYGSNLLEERFLCYIRGGRIPGNTREERGARDSSLPERSEPFLLHHKLFFSKSARKWDGSGVAFLDRTYSEEERTYARRYLITRDQFLDVIRQENAVPASCQLAWDEETLRREGSVVLIPNSWYGRLLYLGTEEGIPMYSFTCVPATEDMEINPATGGYYDVIADGLRETWKLTDDEIRAYLRPVRE